MTRIHDRRSPYKRGFPAHTVRRTSYAGCVFPFPMLCHRPDMLCKDNPRFRLHSEFLCLLSRSQMLFCLWQTLK